MANNVFTGRPNILVAHTGATFESAGITTGNTTVIYEAGPTGYKSYRPNRSINGISEFKAVDGYGYLIYSKNDIDLTAYLARPITGGDSAEFISQNF